MAPQTIVIMPGDTLWELSRKHRVPISEIKRANGLTGDTIYAGEKLIIPGSSEAPPPNAPPPNAPSPNAPRTIVIVPGDTLWELSRKHGVPINEIMRANGLTGDTIYAGEKLIIP